MVEVNINVSFHFRRLLAPNIQKREFLKEGATSISQQVRISSLSLLRIQHMVINMYSEVLSQIIFTFPYFIQFVIFIWNKITFIFWTMNNNIRLKNKYYGFKNNPYDKSTFSSHLSLKGLIVFVDKNYGQLLLGNKCICACNTHTDRKAIWDDIICTWLFWDVCEAEKSCTNLHCPWSVKRKLFQETLPFFSILQIKQ